MSVYIGQTGADYLSFLYGDRHLMSAYLGQSIVYDPDEGGVPAELKTYRFDEKQAPLDYTSSVVLRATLAPSAVASPQGHGSAIEA
jgi:hypothetical protein